MPSTSVEQEGFLILEILGSILLIDIFVLNHTKSSRSYGQVLNLWPCGASYIYGRRSAQMTLHVALNHK